MRVSHNGNTGELVIEDCQILRYNESGGVRKFYQQFLVRFDPDGSVSMPRLWWSISNWGAGAEAPAGLSHSDLKGQLKSTLHSSGGSAVDANNRQVRSKMGRGYTHFSQYSEGALVDPPPKMLTEVGAVALTSGSRQVLTPNPAFTRPPLPATRTRVDKSDLLTSISSESEQLVGQLQTEVNAYAEVIMNAIGNGDIPRAISQRHSLLNLLTAVTALQDNANGQLEVVNAKLAAALS